MHVCFGVYLAVATRHSVLTASQVFSGIIVALLFGMVLLEGQGLTIADVEGASKLVNWSRVCTGRYVRGYWIC